MGRRKGIHAAVATALSSGIKKCIVSSLNYLEASEVPGMNVFGAENLSEAFNALFDETCFAKNIESKIRKELESMLKDDRENYISFFKTFGVQLKYGVYNNYGADKDKLKEMLISSIEKA